MQTYQHGDRVSEDRLVRRITRDGGTWSTGKRVGKDCPVTPAERREYVTGGIVAFVKVLKYGRKLSLRQAMDLANEARGEGRTWVVTRDPARHAA